MHTQNYVLGALLSFLSSYIHVSICHYIYRSILFSSITTLRSGYCYIEVETM